MSYEAIKRHGGNLNAYHQVKVVKLKRLNSIASNRKIFWKRPNYGGSRKRSVVSNSLEERQ
jgi:hypothetical protein